MAKRSTLSDLDEAAPVAALVGRRTVLSLVLVFVLLAVAGFLGVRTDSVTRSAGGYTLTLDYPGAGRAGLDVIWRARVTHPGGFEKELTLAVTGNYFDIFETQGFFPEPSKQVRDGDVLYLTFDAPEGPVFTVDYDSYIQPASHRGRSGHLAVVSSSTGGEEIVGLDYRTRLVP